MNERISVSDVRAKKGGDKIVSLTAYSYPIARIIDKHCDIILVGDSLSMCVYGMKNTLGANMQMMINHACAVVQATHHALVVVDLPFGSYEQSKQQALDSAKEMLIKTRCDAIKIETTLESVETVKFLTENGVEVMAHVGLLPQSVEEISGYKYQGLDEKSADEIANTSKLLEEAGAFALVIEAVPESLADRITREIGIPTIGIGASLSCDGQVLVIDDILGMNPEFKKPRFVKEYASLADEIDLAAASYASDVRSLKFPTEKNLLKPTRRK